MIKPGLKVLCTAFATALLLAGCSSQGSYSNSQIKYNLLKSEFDTGQDNAGVETYVYPGVPGVIRLR